MTWSITWPLTKIKALFSPVTNNLCYTSNLSLRHVTKHITIIALCQTA